MIALVRQFAVRVGWRMSGGGVGESETELGRSLVA